MARTNVDMQKAATTFQIALLFGIGSADAHAESNRGELATPLIENYPASDYGEEDPQIWSMTEDQRGVMYFGAGYNIVQFDGQHWTPIPVPSAPVRSMGIDRDGTIYAALGEGDFGYLAGDATGVLHYVSLLDKLPESEKPISLIKSCHVTSHGVYFVSDQKIYRFRQGTVAILKDPALGDGPFVKGHSVGDAIYVVNRQKGISVIDGKQIRRIPHFEEINISSDLGRVFIMPWSAREALIATAKRGLYLHDFKTFLEGRQGEAGLEEASSFIEPLQTEADAYIQEHSVYSGALLNEREVAVGTVGGGILILDKKGGLIRIVNSNRGLLDDSIYALFVDRFGDLWAGTNVGIAHILTSSPISVLDKHNGADVMILDIRRHNGSIRICAFGGIYSLPDHHLQTPDDKYDIDRDVNVKGSCFAMIEHKGALLGVDGRNIVRISGRDSRLLIQMAESVLGFGVTQRFPDHVFVGLDKGLAAIKTAIDEENELTAEVVESEALNKIQSSFDSLMADAQGNLWASTREQGLYQLKWRGTDIGDFDIFHYGEEDGLPGLTHNKFYLANGELLLGTKKGIYRIEPVEVSSKGLKPARIVAEARFAQRELTIAHIEGDDNKNLWVATANRTGVIRESEQGRYEWDTAMMAPVTDEVSTLYADRGDVLWLGTVKGIYRFDAKKPKNYEQSFNALIRKVSTADKRVLHNGEYLDPSSRSGESFTRVALSQGPAASPVLNYEENALSFEFAAAFYERPEKTEFQYQLLGFDKKWSDFGEPTTKEYTNLPPGEYDFQVRARNIYGQLSRPAGYRFSVLPPWYRTFWAYLGYVAIAVLVLAGSVRLYNWRLVLARERLKKIVKERTREVVRQKDEIAAQRDQIKEAKDALWGEMQLAKKIQTVLLPEEPQVPGYEIAGYMDPADEVGGDYYDVFNIKNTNWIVIGDVSGHGVPAGLVMMMVQTSIRSVLEYYSDASPDKILILVNRVIYENIHKLSESKYMTITLFSAHENGVMYFSGLHQDLMIFRAETGAVETVETDGSWIGMIEDIDGLLEVGELRLSTGDALLLHTDGITEAGDSKGEMFSKDKLAELLKRLGSSSAEEIKQGIISALGGYKCQDDITFVVLKKQKE